VDVKFTPGPWELRQSTRHGYWFIDYPQQEGSATLTKLDCGEADACLIAAAPDLLAALREAIEIIEGTGLDASPQRAAIAKATGEQP